MNNIDGNFDEAAPMGVPATPTESTKVEAPNTGGTLDLDGTLDDLLNELESPEESTSMEPTEGGTEEATKPSIDYEKVYASIFEKPIKAAGKEITLKSPEEAVRLIQMGADYSRKMESLKADRQLVEALKAGGVTDKNKVNQMIDIMNGSPEAVYKLITDLNLTEKLQEFEYTAEDDIPYNPKNYVPSSSAIELKDVVEKVQSTPQGVNFVSDVVDTFDADSIKAIETHPQVLEGLYADKESGLYDTIMEEVTRRIATADPRVLGMNMLNVYGLIGSEILREREEQANIANVPDFQTSLRQQNQDQQQLVARRHASTQGVRSAPKALGSATNVKLQKLLNVDFDDMDEETTSKTNTLLKQLLGARNG